MCCFNNNGTLDVSNKVVERTIELTKELMAKYGISADRVLRHYDVTGKNCPAPFVRDVNRWNDFKARIGDTSTPSVPSSSGCDQILRVGSVVRIDRPLTVTAISGNLIAIQELTGKPTASYHWFDPTNFEVVEGPKKAKQVCTVGCKVKLHGNYSVLGLVKTEDWACKLKIGNRTNWVWTEPCYEVQD